MKGNNPIDPYKTPMCNNKMLSSSEGGYVFRCQQCSLYQVAFGTSLLSFAHDQFQMFQQIAKERLALEAEDGFPNHKRIAIELIPSKVHMILCYRERQELTELLNEASFATELQAIIGGLNNQT
jgi:hypothetical protein